MEHQLWKAIVAVLLNLDKPRTPTRFDFSDEDIVKAYYWGGGLSGLPSWVRTHRRVHRWVQAKLVLTRRKRKVTPDDAEIRTCAA